MSSIVTEIDSIFDAEIENVRNKLLNSKSLDYLKFPIYEESFNELRTKVKEVVKSFD